MQKIKKKIKRKSKIFMQKIKTEKIKIFIEKITNH